MIFDFTDHPNFDVEFAKIVAREIAYLEYPDSEVSSVVAEDRLCVNEHGELNNITQITLVVYPKKQVHEISITLKVSKNIK